MADRTTRQRIIDELKAGEYTPRDLATVVAIPLSRLLTELEHVAKSHRQELKVRPARCTACGFQFTKRSRLSTPSRCPKCRSERTEGPYLRFDG